MKKRLFYCYSRELKEKLVSNGEKFIVSAVHYKTKKKYWVFEGTVKLNQLLSEWRSRRKTI